MTANDLSSEKEEPEISSKTNLELTGKNYGADYGADKNGLIWGYIFSKHGETKSIATDISIENITQTLENDPSSFCWMHFATNSASERWTQQHLTLLLIDCAKPSMVELFFDPVLNYFLIYSETKQMC